MPPEPVAVRHRLAHGLSSFSPARLPAEWTWPLARLTAVWLGLIVLLHGDWADMFGQWWDISTYNHILLIPPIIVWLVEQRAGGLARLKPEAWWPGLLLVAGASAIWLLGALAGVSLVRQIGAVALLVACVPALLGPRATAGLLFPLGYMFFLVPAGEELVPSMQMLTAAMTVGLVHLSGIPAKIDGVFIDTPAGLFEVAEACSGVMFLIAMLAFAVLAAHVCFRSWRRRTAFLVFAMAVPILANGVRAWATIFAAQHVGVERAAGFDHIFYGWIFFGLVIAGTMAAAWRHFDRPASDPLIDEASILASPLLDRLSSFRGSGRRVVLGIAAIVALSQGWAAAADRLFAPMPRQIFLPHVPGWTRSNYAPDAWWEPRATGAAHRLLGRYTDASGRHVDVFIAVYGAQGKGRRASTFGEGALPSGSGWAWLKPGPAAGEGKAEWLLGPKRVERMAVTWYRTDELLTGSASRLSLANTRDRLLLRARPTTMLIISAEQGGLSHPGGQSAREAIAAFRRSAGSLDSWMDRIAQAR
jgi:exosortase A